MTTKYKAHRRYREAVVIDAPPRIRVKQKPHPKPSDVRRAQRAIDNLLIKYGTKRYKKRRSKVDRIVAEALDKYNLRKTSSEEYWRLAFTCKLLGL